MYVKLFIPQINEKKKKILPNPLPFLSNDDCSFYQKTKKQKNSTKECENQKHELLCIYICMYCTHMHLRKKADRGQNE